MDVFDDFAKHTSFLWDVDFSKLSRYSKLIFCRHLLDNRIEYNYKKQ